MANLVERERILNCLAGHFATEAGGEKADSEIRKKTIERAIELYKKAGAISTDLMLESADTNANASDAHRFVGRGIIQLLQGNTAKARESFIFAQGANADYIPAKLGSARLHYHNGEYSKALEQYCQVLAQNPKCPPNVRMGIGLCYFMKGNMRLARKAFMRGPSRSKKSAPRSLQRALLMPQVNTGSLYRCGKRTYEQPVGYGRRKGG